MEDGMSFEDKLRAPWNQWNPPPLLIGDRVFSWTAWDVALLEAVEIPGSVQVTFARSDGAPEMVLREPLFQGEVGKFLRNGMGYGIIGLGEKIVAPNVYFQEAIYARIDGVFHYYFMSQGYFGSLFQDRKGYFFSREEKERRRNLFHFLRELYFWTCLNANVFASEAEKHEAICHFRRQANDHAVQSCRDIFGFKAEKYRDNSLPTLDGGGGRTRRT